MTRTRLCDSPAPRNRAGPCPGSGAQVLDPGEKQMKYCIAVVLLENSGNDFCNPLLISCIITVKLNDVSLLYLPLNEERTLVLFYGFK